MAEVNIDAQRSAALEQANTVRLAGHKIRRELASLPYEKSRKRCAELLLSPPDAIGWMRVEFFLRGVQHFGPLAATRIANAAGVPLSVLGWPVRRLTDRQRLALANALRRFEGGR